MFRAGFPVRLSFNSPSYARVGGPQIDSDHRAINLFLLLFSEGHRSKGQCDFPHGAGWFFWWSRNALMQNFSRMAAALFESFASLWFDVHWFPKISCGSCHVTEDSVKRSEFIMNCHLVEPSIPLGSTPCGVQPDPCFKTKISDSAVPPPAESPPTSSGAEPSGQSMSKSVSANLSYWRRSEFCICWCCGRFLVWNTDMVLPGSYWCFWSHWLLSRDWLQGTIARRPDLLSWSPVWKLAKFRSVNCPGTSRSSLPWENNDRINVSCNVIYIYIYIVIKQW